MILGSYACLSSNHGGPNQFKPSCARISMEPVPMVVLERVHCTRHWYCSVRYQYNRGLLSGWFKLGQGKEHGRDIWPMQEDWGKLFNCPNQQFMYSCG